MKMARKILLLSMLVHSLAGSGFAQDLPAITYPDSGIMGALRVTSNVGPANVFVDSQFVGTTPIDSFPVSPGIHVLVATQPPEHLWSAPTYRESVIVRPSETVERAMIF